MHKYLEETLFTDRSNRQGFPIDVLRALAEIPLKFAGIETKEVINEDVWDLQPYQRHILETPDVMN